MDKPFTKYDISAAGCILTGGQSRRMGTDKALMELNGKTLLTIAIERFKGFPEILISAAASEHYAFTGLRVVPDERPGIGPLGGFISVLRAAESDIVCFMPVDAPLVPAEILHLLAGACSGKDAAVPMYKGSVEPMMACLSKASLPVLERMAAEGNYKVADAFILLDTSYVTLESPEMLQKFGEPSAYLINVNDKVSFEKLGSADTGAPF